jgi:hypothetical protein
MCCSNNFRSCILIKRVDSSAANDNNNVNDQVNDGSANEENVNNNEIMFQVVEQIPRSCYRNNQMRYVTYQNSSTFILHILTVCFHL